MIALIITNIITKIVIIFQLFLGRIIITNEVNEMKNNVATKIILLPVIVTLLITLALIFIEGNFEEWKASHIFGLFIILFSSIYFFTILFVLPLYFHC